MLSRRRWVGLVAKGVAGLSLIPVISNCTTDNASTTDAGAGTDAGAATGTGTCSTIPEETEGPYPGDGTNGPNALTTSGIVRSDIRTSLATDLVFGDGATLELPTVTGAVTDGDTAALTVAVAG